MTPDWTKLRFRSQNENGRTFYRWQRANLVHSSPDQDTKKKAARAETKRPDIELTTFESWGKVAQWYAKLENGRVDPTPEIRAKTLELIQGQQRELDKIEALYEYVSKNYSLRKSLVSDLGAINRTRPPKCSQISMATAKTSTPCSRRCSQPQTFAPTQS